MLTWPQGSLGQFMPSGFSSLFLEDPIHIPSVLELFNSNPLRFLKIPNSRNKVLAEFKFERTAVVSSAYWRSFVSCVPILIPSISGFSRIDIAKVSIAKRKS